MPSFVRSTSPVIANGATASEAIPVDDVSSGSFSIPAAFTGTAVTFTGSDTADGTFVAIYNASNAAVSITVAINRAYPLPAECFGFKFIKIVSGSSEAAERTIKVTTKG